MGAAGSILDDKDSDFSPANSPIKNNGKASSVAAAKSIQNNNNNNTNKVDCPTFIVSLGFWPGKSVEIPDQFKLRISFESLDFLRMQDDTPIIQFPFQNIICWGSSRQNFQFKIFDFANTDSGKQDTGILISLKTTQGRKIEDATMGQVRKLMEDMNQRAISKQEFQTLLSTLFVDNNTLEENWLATIDQFSTGGRLFLAKQGMELLIKVGTLAPFEKFDLACLLYERIINKDSFQLLVSTFEDELERDNLIHRLKLPKQMAVKNSAILPEKVMIKSGGTSGGEQQQQQQSQQQQLKSSPGDNQADAQEGSA